MNEALLLIGIGCIIAAAVGGGMSLANLTLPVINSVPRQLLLAGIGLAVVGASFAVERIGSGGEDDSSGGSTSETDPALITLSEGSAPRGGVIKVTGSRFGRGELVEIRVHGTTVGTARADSKGAFTQEITIPESAPPPGFPTSIRALGLKSGEPATAPFSTSISGGGSTVGCGSGSPEISLSSPTGQRGATITVMGNGFCAGDVVDIRFNVEVVGNATVDPNGGFSKDIVVPQSASGTRQSTIFATGRQVSKSGTAPFSIQ